MAPIDDSKETGGVIQPAVGTVQPDMGDLLGIARRGWLVILAGTVFGLACGLLALTTIPPIYKANSRIAIERTLPRYLHTNKVSNEPIIEDYDTMGQTWVISSESVLTQVIRSLSLATDPDFIGQGKGGKTFGARIRALFQTFAEFFSPQKGKDDGLSNLASNNLETVALDRIVRDLTVTREDTASVITVGFSSQDPLKAATIVNAIVDTYLANGIANKMKSTNFAAKVVLERVEELKQQAKIAERAVRDYRAANNIVEGTGAEALTGVHSLLEGLTRSRVAMAEARARMDRVASDPNASEIFTPDNELITKLRADLQDLSSRANDIESRVGKDHLAAVKIRNRMQEIREAITSEQKRIAGSFIKSYELARAQSGELSSSMSRVMGDESANNEVRARLRELESTADTLRTLYNQAVQQSGQMNLVEAQSSITPDARVLMRASRPLQSEASKKRWLILAGGSVLGLFLGVGAVLGRSFPFGVFRTPQQVTVATGLPCAVLPEISGIEEQESLRKGEYVLDWPYSRFSQTLHGIWAMVNIAQREAGSKVICIVSSTPGEGKTTVAVNIAAHFALYSTSRVLIVDADLHRQSLTNILAPDARVGFREALANPVELAKYLVKKERLNLDVLPCPASDDTSNAAELLGSAEMERLMKFARDAYDLVIIEAPPMAPVVDYKMIARHCDRFVFVVEWGKTSQRLVRECLSDASAQLDRALCVILNKAAPSALKSIERYKGKRLHTYYTNQKSA